MTRSLRHVNWTKALQFAQQIVIRRSFLNRAYAATLIVNIHAIWLLNVPILAILNLVDAIGLFTSIALLSLSSVQLAQLVLILVVWMV